MTEKSMTTSTGQGGDFVVPQLAGREERREYSDEEVQKVKTFLEKAEHQIEGLRKQPA